MSGAETPGIVGVIAQDTARFSMFGASLTGLSVPQGTFVNWIWGHGIAANCNLQVRDLLASDAEWLWLLGDDHAFSPDLLMKLLAHDEDIVVPLCLTREPPYKPVIFSDWASDDPDDNYRRRVDLNDHPRGGVIPIHSAGSGGMLVKRHVFERLSDPWFESGAVSGVEIGEDVYFCDKARDAGFGIYSDLDASLGHCATTTVWPVRQPDGWTYGFAMMGGLKITMPVDAWEVAR